MEYLIFNKDLHNSYIPSFLKSAHLAHNQEKRTEEWFNWKFIESPYGEAIIALALEDEEVVGTVAFGLYKFNRNDKVIMAGESYETFVHPDHQGKGIFKNLIKICSSEAKERGVQMLVNFPNPKSLPGFLSSGWSVLTKIEYWIKPVKAIDTLMKLKHLRHPFESKIPIEIDVSEIKIRRDKNTDNIEHIPSTQYLKWRFGTSHAGHYINIRLEEGNIIIRIGKRGDLIEAQILWVNISNNLIGDSIKRLIKNLKELNVDLIGCPISMNHPLNYWLKRYYFFKVPNKTRCCYTVLDHDFKDLMDSFNLTGLDFHTY